MKSALSPGMSAAARRGPAASSTAAATRGTARRARPRDTGPRWRSREVTCVSIGIILVRKKIPIWSQTAKETFQNNYGIISILSMKWSKNTMGFQDLRVEVGTIWFDWFEIGIIIDLARWSPMVEGRVEPRSRARASH